MAGDFNKLPMPNESNGLGQATIPLLKRKIVAEEKNDWCSTKDNWDAASDVYPDSFVEDMLYPKRESRTNANFFEFPTRWRQSARKILPLKLPVFQENQGGFCSNCCWSGCLDVCCKESWFFCACCTFFLVSSLPRVNCIIDFIVTFILYGNQAHWSWPWKRVKEGVLHFNLNTAIFDIVVISFLRSLLLFFVFAYSRHREWDSFNLLLGIFVAIGSTTYVFLKLFFDFSSRNMGIKVDFYKQGFPTVGVWFCVWIWIEVLVFGLIRRKKIRLPKISGAVGTKYGSFDRTSITPNLTSSNEYAAYSTPHHMSVHVHEHYFNERTLAIRAPQNRARWKLQDEQEKECELNSYQAAKPKSSPIAPTVPDAEFSQYELPLRYKTSTFMKMRDVSVHFRIERGELAWGQGPSILCLHGFGGGVFSFGRCWEGLRSKSSLVLAFDRPGFGLTSRHKRPWAENPYRHDFAVEICYRILTKLELSKVVIVAHGSGCLVGNYFCRHHPDRVAGLVMLAPVFHAPLLIRSLLKTRLGRSMITQLVRTEMSMTTLRRAWMDSDNIPPLLKEQYRCTMQLENWDNSIWEMLQIEQPSQEALRKVFGQNRHPVMILHGKDDKIVDISESQELEEEWKKCNPMREIRFVTLENVGHVLHEEFPELLIQELDMFLRGASGDEKSGITTSPDQIPTTPGLATRLRSMFGSRSFTAGVCQRSINPQVDIKTENRPRLCSDGSVSNSPGLKSLHGRLIDLKLAEVRSPLARAYGDWPHSRTKDILEESTPSTTSEEEKIIL